MKPSNAKPTEAPKMPDSMIGVFLTLLEPNSSLKSFVILKTPP